MGTANYNIKLFIDGREMPVALVLPLYQNDPFPGDHKYIIHIKGDKVNKLFPDFSCGAHEMPNREITRKCFWFINGVILRDRNAKYKLKYYLNSIRYIIVEEDSIEIQGVCSTVMDGGKGEEGNECVK